MTEFELLRIIAFLERVRAPCQELMPIAEEDPSWNILLHLMKQNLSGAPVTISTPSGGDEGGRAQRFPGGAALFSLCRSGSRRNLAGRRRGRPARQAQPAQILAAAAGARISPDRAAKPPRHRNLRPLSRAEANFALEWGATDIERSRPC